MPTVRLSKLYTVGSTTFDALTFRDPKLIDYRAYGPVTEWQSNVLMTNREAIWSYAERLLEGVNYGALSELALEDALVVEDAIIGFFSDARQRIARRTSSSSDANGSPVTSTA